MELTTVSATHSPAILVADIVDKALEQSALASHDHDHGLKCPKCGSMNLYRIDTLRRRNPIHAHCGLLAEGL